MKGKLLLRRENDFLNIMEIKVFNKVWYDCYSAILNNFIYSLDENRLDVIYNNNYIYKKVTEKREDKPDFYSVNSDIYDQEKIKNVLFEYTRELIIMDKQELFQTICENLKQGNYITISVDMYHYPPAGESIYHVNHLIHNSFLHSYDEKSEVFTVMEGRPKPIGKEDLLNACIEGGGEVLIFKLKDTVRLEPVKLDEILENAVRIADSIEQILNDYDIWDINNPDKSDMDYLVVIGTTHLDSITHRNRANEWLFTNVCADREAVAAFEKVEYDAKILRRKVLKACTAYDWNKILYVKEALRNVLMAERDAWKWLMEKYK